MIHYPQIDPVALSIGPISIYWYGLTYVGGLIFAWWLGKQRAQLAQSPVSEEQIDDLIFYAALGIVAGGRVGYALFYGAGSLWDDPLRVFRLWEGGMAFHGGFLGVV
ncbi:MAG: prolipoprotein diacylglyceryl transferase, partial [Halieaceae bacterium]|nr:prolipoprotein diacylglyceryl transferase [Halieaceae bacterium]